MSQEYRMKISPIILALLLFAGCSVAADRPGTPEARYRELVKIVDRHTGFAHFTRGMNRYTVEALQKAVGENDIPVLLKMLEDKDRIVVMTAVNVLMRMGAQGRRSVYATLMTTADKECRDTITDQLKDIPYDLTVKFGIPGWTDDIPVLKRMADSRDLRIIWAARDLMKAMGEPGKAAIREVLAATKNERTRDMLREGAGR